MAQFFTDFSDSTLGAFPTGWTDRLNGDVFTVEEVIGAAGDKVLRKPATGGGTNRVITFNAFDAETALNRATVETVTRFRVVSGDIDMSVSAVRALLTANPSRYDVGYGNATERRITRGGDVGFAVIAASAGGVPDISTSWWWCRAQAVGTSPTTLRARFWLDGDAEPGTWAFDTTDATAALQEAGLVGLSPFGIGVYEYDLFGVGTGGDAAPTEAPAVGGPTHPFTSISIGI